MKKHQIKLKKREKEWLYKFTQSGSANHQAFKRAQILLAVNEYGAEMKDNDIANIIGVNPTTLYKTRERYLKMGVEKTVERKVRHDKGIPVKVDGRVEAQIIALACSDTANGEVNWTLKMIADEVVRLDLVESISTEKVRQVLKKRTTSPSQQAMEHST